MEKPVYDNEKLRRIVSKRTALFKKKPEAARYQPKVSSRHVLGLYTETSVRKHTVKADYPEPAGGTDQAPNPIELLLAALAACIEGALYEFAVHEGLRIDSISIEIEGELDLRGLFMVDDTVPAGFGGIRYSLKIESPEEEEKVRALAERVIAHCPVVDSLIRPVNIDGKINISRKEGKAD